jgi:ribose transport system ATP-binding protein
MGMVPRNRREQGLVLNMSVNDNINLASLDRVATAAFVDHKRARGRATTMIDSLKIRTPSAEAIVRYLSGGNQQKTVIAKWLTSDARVYILDEPTTGVDVAARVEIYSLINDLVARGGGVVLFSSDIPELLGMADRILVMFRGQIVKELVSREATPDQVLYWATGGKE